MPPFSPPPSFASSSSSPFSSSVKLAVPSPAQPEPRGRTEVEDLPGGAAFRGKSRASSQARGWEGSSLPCSSVSSSAVTTPQADAYAFPSFPPSVASSSQTPSLSVTSTSSGPSPPLGHLVDSAHKPNWTSASPASSPSPCSPQAFPCSPDALLGACIPLPPVATGGKISCHASLPPFCVIVTAVSPLVHTSSSFASSCPTLCSPPRLQAGSAEGSRASSFESPPGPPAAHPAGRAASPHAAAAVSSSEGCLSREQVAACLSLSSSFVYAAAVHSCSQLRCPPDCVYISLSNEVYLLHVPALLFAQELSRPTLAAPAESGAEKEALREPSAESDGLSRLASVALFSHGSPALWGSPVYPLRGRRYKTRACAEGVVAAGPLEGSPFAHQGAGRQDACFHAGTRRRSFLTEVSCQSLSRPTRSFSSVGSGDSVASASCPVSRGATFSGEDLWHGDRRSQPSSRPPSLEALPPLHALSGVGVDGADRSVLGGFLLSPETSALSPPPSVLLSLLSKVLPAPFPSLWPPLVLLQTLREDGDSSDEGPARLRRLQAREVSPAAPRPSRLSHRCAHVSPLSAASSSAASSVLVLGHAYAMSVCTHMGTVRSVQLHPATACTALLLFADVEGWGVHVWREREPCSGAMELAVRVELSLPSCFAVGTEADHGRRAGRGREAKRRTMRAEEETEPESAPARGLESRFKRSETERDMREKTKTGSSPRSSLRGGRAAVQVAVLELDERQHGIGGSGLSALDFGLTDCSPFAAVPRQHILFFHLASEACLDNDVSNFFSTQRRATGGARSPRAALASGRSSLYPCSRGQEATAFCTGSDERRPGEGEETARRAGGRKRSREKSERRQFAFLGAFMVDGLSRGAVGRPVVQRVAGPAQVPVDAGLDVVAIEKAELCEISLMTSFLTVSSSSAVPPVPAGVVVGAAVAGGLPLCGASAAIPPLVGPRQQQQILSTQRRASAASASVAAMGGNLVWGELSGLLASAIPPCRLTLRTGAHDLVELLLSPLVLCCSPEGPSPHPETQLEGGAAGEDNEGHAESERRLSSLSPLASLSASGHPRTSAAARPPSVVGPSLHYALRCLSSVSRSFDPVSPKASLGTLWPPSRSGSLLRPLGAFSSTPSSLLLLPLQQTLAPSGLATPSQSHCATQLVPPSGGVASSTSVCGAAKAEEEDPRLPQQRPGGRVSPVPTPDSGHAGSSRAQSPCRAPSGAPPGGDPTEGTASRPPASPSASRASPSSRWVRPSLVSLAVLPAFNVAAGVVATPAEGEAAKGRVFLWYYSDMLAGSPPVCCLQSLLVGGDGRVRRAEPNRDSLRREGRASDKKAAKRGKPLPLMRTVSWLPASSLALFQRTCTGAGDGGLAFGDSEHETLESPIRVFAGAGERENDETLNTRDMLSGRLPVLVCVAADSADEEDACKLTKARRRPFLYAFEVDLLHALFGIREVSLAFSPSLSPLLPQSPPGSAVSSRSHCASAAGRRSPFFPFSRIVASQVLELPVVFLARTIKSRLLLLLLVENGPDGSLPPAASGTEDVQNATCVEPGSARLSPPSASLSYALFVYALGPLRSAQEASSINEQPRDAGRTQSPAEENRSRTRYRVVSSIDGFGRRGAGSLCFERLGVWAALSPGEMHATLGSVGEPLLHACVVSSSALLLASPLFFLETAETKSPAAPSSPSFGASRLSSQHSHGQAASCVRPHRGRARPSCSTSVGDANASSIFSGGAKCFLFLLRLAKPRAGTQRLRRSARGQGFPAVSPYGDWDVPRAGEERGGCALSRLSLFAVATVPRRRRVACLALAPDALAVGTALAPSWCAGRGEEAPAVETDSPLVFVYSLRGLPLVVPFSPEATQLAATLPCLSRSVPVAGRPQPADSEAQPSSASASESQALSGLAQGFACAKASGAGVASLTTTARRDGPCLASPNSGVSSPVLAADPRDQELDLARALSVLAAVAAAPHVEPEAALPLVGFGKPTPRQTTPEAARRVASGVSAAGSPSPNPSHPSAPSQVPRTQEVPSPAAGYASAYGRLRSRRRGQGMLAVPPPETEDRDQGDDCAEGGGSRSGGAPAVSETGRGLEPSSGDASSSEGVQESSVALRRVAHMGFCRLPGAAMGLLVKTVECGRDRGAAEAWSDQGDAGSCVYLFVCVSRSQMGDGRVPGSGSSRLAPQFAPHIWLRLLPLPPEDCLPSQLQAFYRHPLVAGLRDAWWGPEASASLLAFLALPPSASGLGGFTAASSLDEESGDTSRAARAPALPHHTPGALCALAVSRQAAADFPVSPGSSSVPTRHRRAAPVSARALLVCPVPGLVQAFSLHTLLPFLLPVATLPWAPLAGAPASPPGGRGALEGPPHSLASPLRAPKRATSALNPTNAAAATVASVASSQSAAQASQAAIAQQHEQREAERRMLQVGAPPLLLPYHPAVVGSLFSSGFVGTVKWILGTLLRCLRAAGLTPRDKSAASREGREVGGNATKAARSETERLLGGHFEDEAKRSRGSEAGSDGLWDPAPPDEADAGDGLASVGLYAPAGGAHAVCACPEHAGGRRGTARPDELCCCCCVLQTLLQASMTCLSAVFLQFAAQEQELLAARASRVFRDDGRKGPRDSGTSSARQAAGAAWDGGRSAPSVSVEAAPGDGGVPLGPATGREAFFVALLRRCGVAGRGEAAGASDTEGRDLKGDGDRGDAAAASGRDDLPGFTSTSFVAGASQPRRKLGERAEDLFGPASGQDEDDPFDVSDLLGFGKKKEVDFSSGSSTCGASRFDPSACGSQNATRPASPLSSTLSCLSASSAASLDPLAVCLAQADFEMLLQLLALEIPGLRLSPLEQRQLWGFVAALRALERGQGERGYKPVSTLVEDFPLVAAAVLEAAGAASEALVAPRDAGTERTGDEGLSARAEGVVAIRSAARANWGGWEGVDAKEPEPRTKRDLGPVQEQAARLAGNALRSWALRTSTAAADSKRRRAGELDKEACLARARLGLLQLAEADADLSGAGARRAASRQSSRPLPALLLSSEDLCWCVQADGEEAMLAEAVAAARKATGAQDKLLWSNMKKRGVGFWLRSTTQVRALADLLLKDATVLAAAEAAAQGAFGAQGGPDGDRAPFGSASAFSLSTAPAAEGEGRQMPGAILSKANSFHQDCAALWAVASDRLSFVKAAYKQRKNMKVVEFLSRDFGDPRWQAAAEKNAYKLVQQRRYHLALAFFILARQIREVCDLCCRQLEDVQLALFLCRLVDATQRPCGPPLGTEPFSFASAFSALGGSGASDVLSPSPPPKSGGAGSASPSSPVLGIPGLSGSMHHPSLSPPPLSSPTLGAVSPQPASALPGGTLSPSGVSASPSCPATEYRRVLFHRVAPLAAAAGDVWLLHLAFWLAGDHRAAFFVLLPPHLPPKSFSHFAPHIRPHAPTVSLRAESAQSSAFPRGCAGLVDRTTNWLSGGSDVSTLTPFDPRSFFSQESPLAWVSLLSSPLSSSVAQCVASSSHVPQALGVSPAASAHAETGPSFLHPGMSFGSFFSNSKEAPRVSGHVHADADSFDGGTLRHSQLSLSLVAFQSVVQNALPIKRLRAQLEEQHAQLQIARELHAQLRSWPPSQGPQGAAFPNFGPREDPTGQSWNAPVSDPDSVLSAGSATEDGGFPGAAQHSRSFSFASLPSRGSSVQRPFHFLHHSSGSTLTGLSDTTRGDSSEIGGGAGGSGQLSVRRGRGTEDADGTVAGVSPSTSGGGSRAPEREQGSPFDRGGGPQASHLPDPSNSSRESAAEPHAGGRGASVSVFTGAAEPTEARGACGGVTPTGDKGAGGCEVGADVSGVPEFSETAVIGETCLWALTNPAAAATCEFYLLTLAYLQQRQAFLAALASTRFLALARGGDLDEERRRRETRRGHVQAPGREGRTLRSLGEETEAEAGRRATDGRDRPGDSLDLACSVVARGAPTAQAAFDLLFASWVPCLTVDRSLLSSEAALQIRLPFPEDLFVNKPGRSATHRPSADLSELTGLNAGTLLLLPESPFASLVARLPVSSAVSEKPAPSCLHCGVAPEAASASLQGVALSLPDTVAACFVSFLDRFCGDSAGLVPVFNKALLAASSLAAAAARKSAAAYPFSPHCPACRPQPSIVDAETPASSSAPAPSPCPSVPSVAAPPVPSAGEAALTSTATAFQHRVAGSSPIRALGLLECIASQLLLWSDRRRRSSGLSAVSDLCGDRVSDTRVGAACSCAEKRLLQAIQAAEKLGGGRRLAAVAANVMAWAAGVGPVATAVREQRFLRRLRRAPETDGEAPGDARGFGDDRGTFSTEKAGRGRAAVDGSPQPADSLVPAKVEKGESSATVVSPSSPCWAVAAALGGRLPAFFEEDTQHLASSCFLAALRAAALGRRAAVARRCEEAPSTATGPSRLVSRRGRKAAWRLARFCAAGWVRSEALLDLSWRREVQILQRLHADEAGELGRACRLGVRGGDPSGGLEGREAREAFSGDGTIGVLAKELIAIFDAPERQLFDSLALFCCTAAAASALDVSLSADSPSVGGLGGDRRHEETRPFVCKSCREHGEELQGVSAGSRPSASVHSLEQLQRLFELVVVALACVSLCLSAAFPFLALFFSLHPSTHTGAHHASPSGRIDRGPAPGSAKHQRETAGGDGRALASSGTSTGGPDLRSDEARPARVSAPSTPRAGANREASNRDREDGGEFGASGDARGPDLGEDDGGDARPFHPLQIVLHIAVYLQFILMQPQRSTWRVELRKHLQDFLWPRLQLVGAAEEPSSSACEAKESAAKDARGEVSRGSKSDFFPASSSLLQCLATCLSVKVFEFLLDVLRAVDREALRLLHFLQLLSLVPTSRGDSPWMTETEREGVSVKGAAVGSSDAPSSSSSGGLLPPIASGPEAEGFTVSVQMRPHALWLQERQISHLRGWIDRLCFSLSSFLCTHLRPLLTRAAPPAAAVLLPLLCNADQGDLRSGVPGVERSVKGPSASEVTRVSLLDNSFPGLTKSTKGSLLCRSISVLLGAEASQLWILLGCTSRLQWLFSQLPLLPLPQPVPPSGPPGAAFAAPSSGGGHGRPKDAAAGLSPAGPGGAPAATHQKLSVAGVVERAARAAVLPGGLSGGRGMWESAGPGVHDAGVGGFGGRAGKKSACGDSLTRMQLQQQLVRAGIPHLLVADRPYPTQKHSGSGRPLSRLQQQILADLPSLRTADELVASGAFPGVPCVLGGLFPAGKVCSIAASRPATNAVDALRKTYDHHLPSFLTPQAVALLLAEAAGLPSHTKAAVDAALSPACAASVRPSHASPSSVSSSLSPWWSSPCCAIPLCAVLGPVTAACCGSNRRRHFPPVGASISTDLAIAVGPLEGLSAQGGNASSYVLRTVRIPPSLLGSSSFGGSTCTASLLYGAAAAVHATAAATAAVAAAAEEDGARRVARRQAALAPSPEVDDVGTADQAARPDPPGEPAGRQAQAPKKPCHADAPSKPSATQSEGLFCVGQGVGPSDAETGTEVARRSEAARGLSQRSERAEALQAEARWLLSVSAPLVSEVGGPGGAFVGIAPLRRATVNSSQHLQRRLRMLAPLRHRQLAPGLEPSKPGGSERAAPPADALVKTSSLLTASWAEGSVLLSVWFGYLLTRDTSLFAYAQVDRMSAAMRLLAAAAAADVAAPVQKEGSGSQGAAKPGGPAGGAKGAAAHPLSPTGMDPSAGGSSSSAAHGLPTSTSLEPTFPYQAFPSLSVLRSRFAFTGAVSAHPFLPIFAAALQAVDFQSCPATAFAAILRPFGAHARSLPKAAPAALPPPPDSSASDAARRESEPRESGSGSLKGDSRGAAAGSTVARDKGSHSDSQTDRARRDTRPGAEQLRAEAENARVGELGLGGAKGVQLGQETSLLDSRSGSLNMGALGRHEGRDSETGQAASVGSAERRQVSQPLRTESTDTVADRGEGSFSFDGGLPAEMGKGAGAKGRAAGARSPGGAGLRAGIGSSALAAASPVGGGARSVSRPQQEARLQSFGNITAAVWSESGDSLYLADSNGWVRVFGLLRGPLMPPSAAVSVAAAAADPETASRLGMSSHLPRGGRVGPSPVLKESMLAAALQQVSRPTVAWRAHMSTAEVLPLFGCGSWLLTRGVGLFPHAIRQNPVLVEGCPCSPGASDPEPWAKGTGAAEGVAEKPRDPTDPDFLYRRGRGREEVDRARGVGRSASVGGGAPGEGYGDDEDHACGSDEGGLLRGERAVEKLKHPMRVSVQAHSAGANGTGGSSGGLGGRGVRTATPPGRTRASAGENQRSGPATTSQGSSADLGESGEELRRRERGRCDSATDTAEGGAKASGGHHHHPFSIFRRGRGKGCCEAAAAGAGGGLGRMRTACLPGRRRESVSATTETEKEGPDDVPLGSKRRRVLRMVPNAARRRFKRTDVIAKIHSRLLQYQSLLQLRHASSQLLSRKNSQRDVGEAGKWRSQGSGESKPSVPGAVFDYPYSGTLTRGRIGPEGFASLSGDCALYSDGDGNDDSQSGDVGPLATTLPLQQWTSALFGFGGPGEVSDEDESLSGKERLLGKTSKQLPRVAGPCICVWDLWDMTEGGPRLDCVITCDDLLLTRAQHHLASAGPAATARVSKRGKKAKKSASASETRPGRDTWEVVPTHTPTCMCVAVLQDGSAACGCCSAAASGGCACSTAGSLSAAGGSRTWSSAGAGELRGSGGACALGSSCRCCSWCCGSMRCVLYGDTDGLVHAVDLAAQEEIHRWRAHPSAVVACAVSRPAASPSHASLPASWLITATVASAADATFRCWSLSSLAGGPPFLLYEFTSPGHVPRPLREAGGRAPRAPAGAEVGKPGGVAGAGNAFFSSWHGELGDTPGVVVGSVGAHPEERRNMEAVGLLGEGERPGMAQQPPQSVSPFSPFAPSSANALVRLLGGDARDTKETQPPGTAEESVSMMQVVGPGQILTVRQDGIALLNRL
ncbi:AGAP010490-PA, related [Neospora caninum Liverpool]|uniref:AGAP010490-PA, related n=1 Tax=Neospora caninum (strain Liverpool) TaxID=572307 RepID=F0VHR9_NEOCL|nr:AGAP010490-PA, related [Neospora caninum Liverpool]CBZ53280.1 AGAP010490-PA, related [Neospora caninum Liverpool]CEL67266.1 TPA: AGAP010490-PA, related [Neospora caninum Liverpool]|eukprot:XP_003883312.1 AGAP010490-PA, related [Neospora caninum Liverpool]